MILRPNSAALRSTLSILALWGTAIVPFSATAEEPPSCHGPATEAATPAADSTATAASAAAEAGLPATKIRIPDVSLLDQNGEPVSFYSDLVDGRVVAMNFVFTTCTTICPPMGATFGKLERLLEQSGSDARLISISIDPAIDTPARLKAWSESFAAGNRWTLVTGTPHEVNRLLKALGVFSPEKSDHSPVALIGNAATGEWRRTSGFTAPTQLASELQRLAAGRPAELAAVGAEAGR